MSNDAWKALCDFAKHPDRGGDPREPWEVVTTPRPVNGNPLTRKRRVTMERALKLAARAGVAVSGVIVKPDGSVTLELGSGSPNGEPDVNEWDSVKQ
jgi:hypothetical protein